MLRTKGGSAKCPHVFTYPHAFRGETVRLTLPTAREPWSRRPNATRPSRGTRLISSRRLPPAAMAESIIESIQRDSRVAVVEQPSRASPSAPPLVAEDRAEATEIFEVTEHSEAGAEPIVAEPR